MRLAESKKKLYFSPNYSINIEGFRQFSTLPRRDYSTALFKKRLRVAVGATNITLLIFFIN
jgi:hypothetical protein